MRADHSQFGGDAFGDALCDALCDAFCAALNRITLRAQTTLQIAASSAGEEVRQIGVPATFPCASASRAAPRRMCRCSCAPLCRPFCRPLCDPICGPARTDHALAQNSPEIDAFQHDRRIRQRGVQAGSRRARGVSRGTQAWGRCTSEAPLGAFLSWNGSDTPYSPHGAPGAAARPQTHAPRRRLRNSSSGRWSR
jgi:hypothetical protein